MLSVSAMRLAAVEVLCPTAALAGTVPFPTMAGANVFDSRAVALDDLDPDATWTPSLSVYSEGVTAEIEGDIAPSTHARVMADLVIEAELAVRENDEDGAFADAARSDPQARLRLDALCAQVRKRLAYDPDGILFRSGLVASIDQIRIEPYSVPNLGLRFMRTTMTFRCHIADDQFSDAAGLTGPVQQLMQALPAGSYALATLEALDALFLATPRTSLEGVSLHVPPLSAVASLPTEEVPTAEIVLP